MPPAGDAASPEDGSEHEGTEASEAEEANRLSIRRKVPPAPASSPEKATGRASAVPVNIRAKDDYGNEREHTIYLWTIPLQKEKVDNDE